MIVVSLGAKMITILNTR